MVHTRNIYRLVRAFLVFPISPSDDGSRRRAQKCAFVFPPHDLSGKLGRYREDLELFGVELAAVHADETAFEKFRRLACLKAGSESQVSTYEFNERRLFLTNLVASHEE